MTLNLTSRRHTGVRSRTSAIPGVCLALLLTAAAPCLAQHGGGGMGGRSSGGMEDGRDNMRGGGFDQPMSQPRTQPHVSLQLGLGGRWWDEHKTVKKLNLSTDQQHRMDSIFEANKPTLIALYLNLQREKGRLASLPPGDLQDQTKVFAAIDRVSQASTDLEKETAHYLIQIRQQLDPKQLKTLDHEIASLH